MHKCIDLIQLGEDGEWINLAYVAAVDSVAESDKVMLYWSAGGSREFSGAKAQLLLRLLKQKYESYLIR